MMRQLARLWLITVALGAWVRANGVLDWNAQMMSAVRNDNSGPTLSSRNLAILHLALYDTVNSVNRTFQPYLGFIDAPVEVSVDAAVAAAGREIMSALYPSFDGSTEVLFVTQVAALNPGTAVTNGMALGVAAARRMLDARSGDGSTTQVPYIPSAEPGQWRRTPPFFRPPLDPHWRYVKPFGIPETERFVPPPPPGMDSPEYAEAFALVKELGAKNSASRTPEQRDIAVFWSDFSYTAMPPGHWHEIAAQICRNFRTTLDDTARLFALISVAQADSAMVCWEAKYRFNTWRPVTAIRRGDEDGNEATEADPAWESLLNSPPFPEYTSGHSTFSKASAMVLTRFFGTDSVEFIARSDSLPGVIRSFNSFSACADEVGMSRIYGGIHFPFANREGKRCGARVADYVCRNFCQPLAELPNANVDTHSAAGAIVRVHGHIGRECVLESSSDLLNWSEIGRGRGVPGGFAVADPAAAQAMRFYRVAQE